MVRGPPTGSFGGDLALPEVESLDSKSRLYGVISPEDGRSGPTNHSVFHKHSSNQAYSNRISHAQRIIRVSRVDGEFHEPHNVPRVSVSEAPESSGKEWELLLESPIDSSILLLFFPKKKKPPENITNDVDAIDVQVGRGALADLV
ncbi:hypothetical protein VNO77_31162 [Canavalia gladiata]|uniref:Uncharacterized protein n=1 Tax=Canavalia gladiata TaxID=3824 RepID=A0AAN9KQT4_CANGL